MLSQAFVMTQVSTSRLCAINGCCSVQCYSATHFSLLTLSRKSSRDFGVARARDADAALIAMLEGVTHAEVFRRAEDGRGTAVSSTRTAANGFGQGVAMTEAQKAQAGFYFDVNGPNNTDGQTDNTTSRTGGLIDTTAGVVGGRAAQNLWAAAAAAYGDNEPEFFYLVIDPRTYQDIRSANLLDEQDRISDGNIDVPTLLQGKFRLSHHWQPGWLPGSFTFCCCCWLRSGAGCQRRLCTCILLDASWFIVPVRHRRT